jgi:phosphomannomutase
MSIHSSGTEPVLRVYAEAPEMHVAEALLDSGQVAASIS